MLKHKTKNTIWTLEDYINKIHLNFKATSDKKDYYQKKNQTLKA